MKFIKLSSGPLSPVEFAIDKAQYFMELEQCNCANCKTKMAGLREETKALARTINRIRRGSPALCFVAMFEGWTIEKLIDEVNKAVTPATEGSRDNKPDNHESNKKDGVS